MSVPSTVQVLPHGLLHGGGRMGDLLRLYDWTTTPLGSVDTWPSCLTQAASIVLHLGLSSILLWGPKCVSIYNDHYIGILGKKHPAALGKSYLDIWPEVDNVFEPLIKAAFAGESLQHKEMLMQLERNGYMEEFYGTLSASPVNDENGCVRGVLIVGFDSTKQVLHNRRMRLLNELAFAGASLSVDDVCRDIGTVLALNRFDVPLVFIYLHDPVRNKLVLKATSTITNAHPSVIAEIACDPLVQQDGLPNRLSTVVTRAFCENTAIVENHLEDQLRPTTGGPFEQPVQSVVVRPFKMLQPHQPAGVLVIGLSPCREFEQDYQRFCDLFTHQVVHLLTSAASYEAEKEHTKALMELDKAKTAFFNNMSHELRTPLTLIMGPLEEMLADRRDADVLSPTQCERLSLVHRNTIRLRKLVNSMLDYSSLEAGRLRANFEPVALGALTADFASTFRSAVESAGLTFEVDIDAALNDETLLPTQDDSSASACAFVDRDMWEQVVANLLSNALKYTATGSIHVSLLLAPAQDTTAAATPTAGTVVLTVADTGGGIAAEFLPHIFERFYRVSMPASSVYSHAEGTGIGLALTQELVELHGGTISVTSKVDEGTVFTVELPLGMSHLPADRIRWPSILDTSLAATKCNNWSSIQSSLKGEGQLVPPAGLLTILLVDDNADMCQFLSSLLTQNLFNVITTSSGKAALDTLLKEHVDLVMSDVMMPDMDGLHLVKAIRERPDWRTLPIILLSARADKDAQIGGIQAGADDYIAKPFSTKLLLARVKAQLQAGHSRSELERLVQQRTKDLTESEQRYRTLVQMSPVGIVQIQVTDAVECKFIFVNERWTELTCYTDGTWIEGIYPDDVCKFDMALHNAFNRGPTSHFEFQYRCKDGRSIWLLGKFMLCNDQTVLGVFSDVTDLKLLERERLEAIRLAEEAQRHRAEEAEEARATMEMFVDTVCHEIRNPLNGLLSNLDFVCANRLARRRTYDDDNNKDDDDDDGDALNSMQACVEHMNRVTNDVLHLSKMQADLCQFRPGDLVRKTVGIFRKQAWKHGTDIIIVDRGASNDATVYCNAHRIEQVLINLIGHFLQSPAFTPRGSSDRRTTVGVDVLPQPTVTGTPSSPSSSMLLVSEGEPVWLQISIDNAALHLSDDARSSVLECFQQTSFKTQRHYNDADLGLVISSCIVHQLRGRIDLACSPESGTSLTFAVPCGRVNSASKQSATTAVADALGTKSEESRSINVLVVDDNDINQKVLVRQLRMISGLVCSVAVASNGLEAVEMAGRERFDIILMDVEMPVMDGLEATRHIRAFNNRVPIIGVSGNAREVQIDNALAHGMTDYMTKPLRKEMLEQKIRTSLIMSPRSE